MAENVTLTTKQKVIGVLTVVIVAFIIYEVIGLFSGDNTEPVNAPIKQPASTQPAQATVTSTTTVRTAASAQPAAPTPVSVLTGQPKDYSELQKQRQQQEAYLDSVNQLQLLRVKKDIAETNQAIATARLATETANKTMSDLLTQPAILPQAPAGVGVSSVAPGTSPSDQNTQQPAPNAQPANAQILDIPFTVVSVSMQSNRWSAVLGYQDKLYSVITGDSLFDGSRVISINKSGVTLLKDGKRRKISIQTTI